MKIISPLFTNKPEYANPLIKTLSNNSPKNVGDLCLYSDGSNSTDFYHTKMLHASNALKQLKDEVVILVDAFDVVVNKQLDNIVEDFKKQNCNLLISAEANCFPFKQYEEFIASHSNTRLKFPCAGAWIGYREYMIELFDSSFSTQNHMEWRRFTDQGFMQMIYYYSLLENRYSVKIDKNADIFVNTFLLEENKDFTINENKQFVYNETNSIPYFIHFNGDGKVHMPLFGFKYCQ
jgi:hypothetical protein